MADELLDPATGKPLVYDDNEQWIIDEFQEATGKPPTQADIANWSKHGEPGQILVELGGGMEVKTLSDGTEVRMYTRLPEDEDFEFAYSNKEGQVFAVPSGTHVAAGQNYKLVQSSGGYDYYVNEGEESGGVFGGLADLTGISEIEDLGEGLSDVIPNELKSGIVPIPLVSDPFGITQGFWGEEYAMEGRSSLANLTGLKPEEIAEFQDMGVDVASIITAAAGAPYLAAGARSMKSASKVGEGRQDTEGLVKDVAINFAIAGAMDLMSSMMAPKAIEPPAGEALIDPFASPVTDNILIESGVGLPSTPGVTFLGDSALQIPPLNLGTPTLPVVGAPAAGMDWKAIATIGSLALGAGGLGLQAYAAFSDDDDDIEDEKELMAQKYEYEKRLLEMKIDAEHSMLTESLAPVPSSPAPSTYGGGVKKPYGVY